MTFDDIINDIETLCGAKLHGIRQGSDMIIKDVNRETERIELISVRSDSKISRSFAELKKVWEQLNQNVAVHVDSTLAGSGSSRNQPETILANLPYIEFLYIDNKKHIALMPDKTHESGTLR